MISSVRCSKHHFCQIFCMIYNLVHVYTYFVVGTILQCTCTEKHSICKCLRRIPSLCLAPSVELAFAARCMHARITVMTYAAKCVVLPSEQSRSLLSATWFAFLSIEMDLFSRVELMRPAGAAS